MTLLELIIAYGVECADHGVGDAGAVARLEAIAQRLNRARAYAERYPVNALAVLVLLDGQVTRSG